MKNLIIFSISLLYLQSTHAQKIFSRDEMQSLLYRTLTKNPGMKKKVSFLENHQINFWALVEVDSAHCVLFRGKVYLYGHNGKESTSLTITDSTKEKPSTTFFISESGECLYARKGTEILYLAKREQHAYLKRARYLLKKYF